VNDELRKHALKIEHLLQIDLNHLAQKRLNDLIEAYQKGELSADDLRQYTNIDPDKL